jgi:hypothetical protein
MEENECPRKGCCGAIKERNKQEAEKIRHNL